MDNLKRHIFDIYQLPNELGLARLDPNDSIPEWASIGGFTSVVRTSDELSIVCDKKVIPGGVKVELGWRALKIQGPLALSMTGVLSSLLAPLASSEIPVFVVSTFETDYILVKVAQVELARDILKAEGHIVH
jgi:uncharacterized protein